MYYHCRGDAVDDDTAVSTFCDQSVPFLKVVSLF